MLNNNQILRLSTILSLSFREILCNPHLVNHEQPSSRRLPLTEQCASETAEFGDLGNPASLFSNVLALYSECAINTVGGTTADCTFEDVMKECAEAGGQHRILDFETKCDTASVSSSNFPICAGASCDINNFIDVAKVDVKKKLVTLLQNPLLPPIDVDTCILTLDLPPPTPQPACKDDTEFRFQDKEKKSCVWAGRVMSRTKNMCKKKNVRKSCPILCGTCCADDLQSKFTAGNKKRGCKYLDGNVKRKKKLCPRSDVNTMCAKTCGRCCSNTPKYKFEISEGKMKNCK